MAKQYQCEISFFYEADDDHDAIAMADIIASFVESEQPLPKNRAVGAKVMEAELKQE